MKIANYLFPVILLFTSFSCWFSPEVEYDNPLALSEGPGNGYLLLAGGGVNEEIWDKFKYLMGGSENHLVVIPTALNDDSLDAQFLDNYRQTFLNLGFSQVTVLHTRNRETANSVSFNHPLKTATGVWFSGGRQWRHSDAYLNTKTHESLIELLERGGVIGGSSAGATIQGSFLARGDSKGNAKMVGDHKEGLEFITNVAIDQHLLARNRQFDMFEIIDDYPELLGLGIDEKNTAIVVHKNRFQVIGESYVAIYDGTRWSDERDTIYTLPEGSKEFYLLSGGDEYDLERRKIVEYSDRIFVSLSQGEMERIVGTYESKEAEYVIEFYMEHDSLKAHQNWDGSKYPLYAESADRLFIPETDISFEFRFDKEGRALGFYVPLVKETYKKIDN